MTDFPPYIYHMLDYRNLPMVYEHGGLYSDKLAHEKMTDRVSIAHENIKSRRRKIVTPLGCTLDECVPFYFGRRTPMLYALHKNNVKGHINGQKSIAYIVVRHEYIFNNDFEYCFTDGHAAEGITTFYTRREDLDKLDWTAIGSSQWAACYGVDDDFARRKQSEFLVKNFVPSGAFCGIAVYDEEAYNFVARTVHDTLPVRVLPHWYF